MSQQELDPQIKIELESLNSASDVVNRLETEIENARGKFRLLHNDSTQTLNGLLKKWNKSVTRARPYYEKLKESRMAHAAAQHAAMQYQRSNSIYKAAKETVHIAEQRLMIATDEERRKFDSAWQEMLNHSTIKVMEAEKEKTSSEKVHLQKAFEYEQIQKQVYSLEKHNNQSINRTRPYFEMKDRFELQLKQEKMNIEDLQLALTQAKQRYRGSLMALEQISERIHQSRDKQSSAPSDTSINADESSPLPTLRTPGVGAECSGQQSDEQPSLPPASLDNHFKNLVLTTDDDDSECDEKFRSSYPNSPRLPHNNRPGTIPPRSPREGSPMFRGQPLRVVTDSHPLASLPLNTNDRPATANTTSQPQTNHPLTANTSSQPQTNQPQTANTIPQPQTNTQLNTQPSTSVQKVLQPGEVSSTNLITQPTSGAPNVSLPTQLSVKDSQPNSQYSIQSQHEQTHPESNAQLHQECTPNTQTDTYPNPHPIDPPNPSFLPGQTLITDTTPTASSSTTAGHSSVASRGPVPPRRAARRRASSSSGAARGTLPLLDGVTRARAESDTRMRGLDDLGDGAVTRGQGSSNAALRAGPVVEPQTSEPRTL